MRDLTARESDCCSFFIFTVTAEPIADGETVTLEIQVPPLYTDVLAALVHRPTTARASEADGRA